MNRLRTIGLILLVFALPVLIFAQATVSGKVTDAGTGRSLPGANVFIEGTTLGAAADANGNYMIANVPSGNVTISASVIGYEKASQTINLTGSTTINFALDASAIQMSALEVLASRADEKTPVAYTNISKDEMEVRLGSQDIPMILNTTPSVYATQQGGGAGDARINVRGFNQRNVAVMINGVPQNDMENGWVYWSNWDGVGDATSSIQMQRGLSAVNLATPSIGGTMNIITDPTAHEAGGKFKQEMGAGSFMKTTVNLNTGLIADKFAFSTTVVRKTGEGVIDKTWTDAWAYYFGGSFQLNKANRFELYAIGAPQRHGQNLYKQNIGAYDSDFAKDVDGYDETALGDDGQFRDSGEAGGVEFGRNFNQNWAPVNSSYKGKQYFYMYGENTVDRHDPNFLNERENYFHKPLVNFNHYLTLNEQMRISSVLYWSGGSGGGTGTYGKIPTMDADGTLGDDDYKFYYGRGPWVRDWNTLIDYNSGTEDTVYVDKTALARTHGTDNNQSVGILRNSINRQSTIGLISKLNYDLSDALALQFGVDWRTAEIEHAREVRDLMGGDYYLDLADKNEPDGKRVELGDIIAYHNDATVDWIGFFGQGNYIAGPLSAYGMAGMSSIKYSYQDHFSVADEVVKADAISAMQYKGGAMYDLSSSISFFANFGLVEKPPIMDNVIDVDGYVAQDPANENFISYEGGTNLRFGPIAAKLNYYNTYWKDRNLTKAVTQGQGSSGDTDIIYLTGVNQRHTGLEVEISAQPMAMLRLDAAISLGTWKFEGDADGTYTEYTDTGVEQTSWAYALDGLYVGDMPQTSYMLSATVMPISGLRVIGLVNMYDKNYSDWSPDAREYDPDDEDATPDTDQVWQAPGYSKVDLHVYYDLPIQLGNVKLQAFAHVFNALDATFIQDAVDNSQYNGYGDAESHSAARAEVFFGTARYMNMGLVVNF